MKKAILISVTALLAVVVFGGIATAYWLLSVQDRGMTADGRMAPPASVSNSPEAPKFDGAQAAPPAAEAEEPPEYTLPPDFKLPTNLDISTPPVPEGISAPASGQKG